MKHSKSHFVFIIKCCCCGGSFLGFLFRLLLPSCLNFVRNQFRILLPAFVFTLTLFLAVVACLFIVKINIWFLLPNIFCSSRCCYLIFIVCILLISRLVFCNPPLIIHFLEKLLTYQLLTLQSINHLSRGNNACILSTANSKNLNFLL